MSESPETSEAPAPSEAAPPASESAPPGTGVMAVVRWLLVVSMAAAAVAAIGYTRGWFESSGSDEERATQYLCPMHPEVVQDHPATCPICSMDLVAREPDALPAQDPGAGPAQVAGLTPIELTPERIQLAGIRTAPALRAPLAAGVRAVGTVTASESGLGVVHTRVAGWVEELLVDETGRKVRKGQVLARLYSPELLVAEQDLLTALQWASAPRDPALVAAPPGRDLAADARQRLELLGVASQEIDEIARSGTPMRAVAVRSPAHGHVIRKNVVQGQYVQPGTPLFEVADLSKVWVIADLAESESARVETGAQAQVVLVAFPGRRFEGKVELVYPTVAQDTRTVRVRVELSNPDLAIRPGMHGDVEIATEAAEALVVPAEALVDTGIVQYVFVASSGGRFEPRRVRVGLSQGESVQILTGLREGERVVTTANFLIDSESRLAAAIAGLSSETSAGEIETEAEIDKETEVEAGSEAETAPRTTPKLERATTKPVEPAPAAPPAPTPSAPPPAPPVSPCDRDFDRAKYPDKHRQCLACEVQHRGMGSMVDDCKRAISRPWR